MSSIAIIGQGYMSNAHAHAWASAGLANSIKYICTSRPNEGSVPAATNAIYVSDLDIVLNDAEIKYVSVCTPTPTHRDIAIKLLAAGKHVLLEKPIALTISDAKAIAEASDKSSGSLMVAQVVRFFAGYQKLRAASESGDLGKVLSVHARRFSPKPTWATWLEDENQSGGILVDFSIHDFDQLNMYLGNPIEVYATQVAPMGPTEITVRYEGGGVGQVQSYMKNSAGIPFTSTIDLLGTDGIGHYEFSAVSATEESSENGSAGVNSLHIFSAKGNNFERIASDDPYGRQISYFYNQASTEKSYDLSLISAAIVALQVSLAARQSIHEGRPILIADIK